MSLFGKLKKAFGVMTGYDATKKLMSGDWKGAIKSSLPGADATSKLFSGDVKGFVRGSLPGAGQAMDIASAAKSGDWKGIGARMLNPMGGEIEGMEGPAPAGGAPGAEGAPGGGGFNPQLLEGIKQLMAARRGGGAGGGLESMAPGGGGGIGAAPPAAGPVLSGLDSNAIRKLRQQGVAAPKGGWASALGAGNRF